MEAEARHKQLAAGLAAAQHRFSSYESTIEAMPAKIDKAREKLAGINREQEIRHNLGPITRALQKDDRHRSRNRDQKQLRQQREALATQQEESRQRAYRYQPPSQGRDGPSHHL